MYVHSKNISYTRLGGIAAKGHLVEDFNTTESDWSRNTDIQILREEISILAFDWLK